MTALTSKPPASKGVRFQPRVDAGRAEAATSETLVKKDVM